MQGFFSSRWCSLWAVIPILATTPSARADKPTPMYYQVHPIVQEVEKADAAKDYAKAEELSRQILKLPMDPAESEYLMAQLFTPMLWLRDHKRLDAWLADAEKDLLATPDAVHLLWFYSLGWEYKNRFKLKSETIDLGQAKSPVWVRVQRQGKQWNVAMSQDGTNWTSKEVPNWITEKPVLAGVASALIPAKEGEVPVAFQQPSFEPETAAKWEWAFQKALQVSSATGPNPEPGVTLEAHSAAFRMDALADAGWIMQRPVEGDFTLKTQLDFKSKFWEGGIRVALGSGHFAPRLYVSLDRDGIVRCQVRYQDTRGAMASLRLAGLCPAVTWVQVKAAGDLSMLGLHTESIPYFERVMDHDFVAVMQREYSPLMNGYFAAGKEEDLARRFLAWEPTAEVLGTDRVPYGAYTHLSQSLGKAQKWEQSLAVARHGVALCQTRADYRHRRLAVQIVECLAVLDRKKEILPVISEALLLQGDFKAEGQAAVVPPPHWMHTSGGGGENGPWTENLDLLLAAIKYECAGEIWRRVQQVVPAGSKNSLDRMDRVLAGIAAHDARILPEWRDLVDDLKHGVIGGENYFYAGTGRMLEDWQGHDREAMETWMAAARIDSPKTVSGWDEDLPMAEGAVRCALKCGDLEAARSVIARLNERFAANRATILTKTDWSTPGVRILKNAIDQQHPELAEMFVETMDEIVSHATQPWPRSNQKLLAEIRNQLAKKN